MSTLSDKPASAHSVHSVVDKTSFEVPDGGTLLQAALRAEIPHVHACGGHARCSTCRVHVVKGLDRCAPRNEAEARLATKLGLPEHIRLACQTRLTGDVTVRRLVVDEVGRALVQRELAEGGGERLGHERDVAVVFTDIENYTPFAEALPAYDVVHVLSRYYRTMNEIIVAHEGVISDVAGDGILALFGATSTGRNVVADAVASVREMNAALGSFNAYLQQVYGHVFGMRAGVSFGKVVVGAFDIGRMSKLAAIGDVVNMASRIEAANKTFGTRLLLSEAAFESVKDATPRFETHRATLKGKAGEHTLYAIPI